MKTLIALTVLIAAAAPAWASNFDGTTINYGAFSPAARCRTVVATVTSVHTDPTHFGTDIELDRKNSKSIRVYGFIPTGNVKQFPALDSYVGQKVAISGFFPVVKPPMTEIRMTSPVQLEPLSTALAEPKKTYCYLPPIQRW